MSSFVWFLVGPTATGKSAIAVEYAKAYNAEIVGADAFQIYKGLPILSAKPEAAFLSAVPHHLIGEVPLNEPYHVGHYLQSAIKRIHDIITNRNRSVIVVGGTGLYIKALTHGLSQLPSGDEELRQELEELDMNALVQKLQMLDPKESLQIDQRNRRRLIRSIEVCLLTGKPISAQRIAWNANLSPIGQWMKHDGSYAGKDGAGKYLFRERTEHRKLIDQRVETMFNNGVIEEVEQTLTLNPNISFTAQKMLGLFEIQQYLESKISLDDCKFKIKTATAQYAKRQNTWFKRETLFEKWDLTGVESFKI